MTHRAVSASVLRDFKDGRVIRADVLPALDKLKNLIFSTPAGSSADRVQEVLKQFSHVAFWLEGTKLPGISWSIACEKDKSSAYTKYRGDILDVIFVLQTRRPVSLEDLEDFRWGRLFSHEKDTLTHNFLCLRR